MNMLLQKQSNYKCEVYQKEKILPLFIFQKFPKCKLHFTGDLFGDIGIIAFIYVLLIFISSNVLLIHYSLNVKFMYLHLFEIFECVVYLE